MAEALACGRLTYGADSREPLGTATRRVETSPARVAEGLCGAARMAVEDTLSDCTVRIAAARSAPVVEELATVAWDDVSRERTGGREDASPDDGARVSTGARAGVAAVARGVAVV